MKWIIIGLVAFVVIVRFGMMVSSDVSAFKPQVSVPSPQTNADKTKTDKESGRQVIAATGAQALRRAMRDPDSFKLNSVLIMGTGAVCYEYRARNGFNGLDFGQAVLSAKGKLKTDEMGDFSALWNRECANKTGDEEVNMVSFILSRASE